MTPNQQEIEKHLSGVASRFRERGERLKAWAKEETDPERAKIKDAIADEIIMLSYCFLDDTIPGC